MTATLNGFAVTAARVRIPSVGVWFAEVELSHTDALTGAVTLVLEDLTLKGTIISGGVVQARARYRLSGGAGGWGRSIAAHGYTNDGGVTLAKVLGDAARDAGETLGTVATTPIGGAYVRPAGMASQVLHALAPGAWYVDELGVTQVGARPSSTYTDTATRTHVDRAHDRIELAASAIARLLPGVVVDGMAVVDVEHVLEAGTLRTTVWGPGIAGGPRLVDSFNKIVDIRTAGHRFFAPWEYRVVDRHGDRLDLQCATSRARMPDLVSVRVRNGVAGLRAYPALGSLVVVQFVNGDPTRPYVASFDEPDGAGFVADEIFAQAGSTGSAPTEHATSAEAMVLTAQMVIAALGVAISTVPTAPAPAIGTAVAALTGDTPMAALITAIKTGALSTSVKTALLAALAAKSADTGGDTPGLGWPKVRGG